MKFIVEIAYTQKLLTIEVLQGTTVLDAIEQSGILKEFKEIDLKQNKVGIFGDFISLSQVLRNKDRIEIYRPLKIDPKQARLNRIKQKKRIYEKAIYLQTNRI